LVDGIVVGTRRGSRTGIVIGGLGKSTPTRAISALGISRRMKKGQENNKQTNGVEQNPACELVSFKGWKKHFQ
jgi:hypothetical protein